MSHDVTAAGFNKQFKQVSMLIVDADGEIDVVND